MPNNLTIRFSFLVLLLSFTLFINAQTDSLAPGRYKFIDFKPTVFYNAYDSKTSPVLKIKHGDTVHTESLDALGYDKHSNKKGNKGNPLTGPFFIDGASPGDALAITIVDLSLNRNYATTLNAFIPKVLPKKLAKQTWRNAKLVRWELDLVNNTARPTEAYEHLNALRISLQPFLGSIGVAPPGVKSISSGGFGRWGGNLDFNSVTKYATLYLPVFHEGALLYLGDGHAVQGDGELNGDALETSMDFSFTVQVIKGAAPELIYPRVENMDYIMAFGQAKNLDGALKEATVHIINWLQKDYGLTLEEASQVVGPAVEYRIPKLAATEVEVVATLKKDIVKGLMKVNKLSIP